MGDRHRGQRVVTKVAEQKQKNVSGKFPKPQNRSRTDLVAIGVFALDAILVSHVGRSGDAVLFLTVLLISLFVNRSVVVLYAMRVYRPSVGSKFRNNKPLRSMTN